MLLPYSITFQEDLATFLTVDNVRYFAGFQQLPNIQDEQLAGLFYDFSFWRDLGQNLARPLPDARIKPTIQKLVQYFFEQEPYSVMYFVCESEDAKHEGRNLLFTKWSIEGTAEFEIVPFRIAGAKIVAQPTKDIVGSFMFRKNHLLENSIRAYAESEIAVYDAIKRYE